MKIKFREINTNLDGIRPEFRHEFKGVKNWLALDDKNNILCECVTMEECLDVLKQRGIEVEI